MGNTNNHRGVHVQVPWTTLSITVGNIRNYRGWHNLSTVGDILVPWVTNLITVGHTLGTVGNKTSTVGNTNNHRGEHVQVPWVTLNSTVGDIV